MGSLATAAEAVVVALASNGDGAAFDELVRRKQAGVRGLLRRLSNDRALAEDLAQQTFVEMWKSLPRLDAPAAFAGWLRRIAVNVWLQHFRRKHLLVLGNDFGDELPDASPSHESGIDLAAALALLPIPVRLCVVLAYQAGMSHGEIAAETNLPIGTVKSHIVRGSARLRELLRDYGGTS